MKRLTLAWATVALAVAFVLTGVACSPQPTGSFPDRSSRAVKAVRLYVFDGGTLQVDPARFRLKKEEVATMNLSVPCFLIAHPPGKVDMGSRRRS
jgi:hypothetical protein